MKKYQYTAIASLFVVMVLVVSYLTQMPRLIIEDNIALSEFSTKRALEHITEIAQKPHFIGSDNHDEVANYLIDELKNLGLQPEVQIGNTLTDWGNLVKSKNIIAKIKGTSNNKALLLLSHYDSAPHSSSKGASDDGVGLATILESIRAFKHSKEKHKNDIIIVFSDAEELGLNGAALFVKQHKWTKEIGLVLNFEARGTAGPSYMLMEVTNGNANMVQQFSNANTSYVNSNSLMYSIYKMLPNDTDLTVFRQHRNIPGYNFAFIDNHFNYHTQQDDITHLNTNSLSHQGAYAMPLIKYFSNTNLSNLNSTDDDVYFSIPFAFIHYPFTWNWYLILTSLVGFGIVLFFGFGKRLLSFSEIKLGFKLFSFLLITTGLLSFLGWQLLLLIYPEYKEILQGFTYNGHIYIVAFVFLTIAIAFYVYKKLDTEQTIVNVSIAPITIWLIINIIIAYALPGAGFLAIPIVFSILQLGYYVYHQKSNLVVNLITSIPSLIIICPFIIMFPIGLGLKVLVGSSVLCVFVFGLLLPVFGMFENKKTVSIFLFFMSVASFVGAHYYSNFSPEKAKPNSLNYFLDTDSNKAYWATYDTTLDYWTTDFLGKHPKKAVAVNKFPLFSKYKSVFTYEANAPIKSIAKPTVVFNKDTIIGKFRYLSIKITPNRKVNRYDIFANKNITFYNFRANNTTHLEQKGTVYNRDDQKLISYYVINNEPLFLEFSVKKNAVLDMSLLESSFDLLSNKNFSINKRASWMMPKPFVLNDAVVIVQKIKK